MIGILTEKPSAMRNFAKALGGQSGTYNGESYTLVAARGHLYEYADPSLQVSPALQAQYKSWDLQYLPWDERAFQWKREKKPDVGSMLTTIKATLGQCSEIVIATDVDPTGEGELLAVEILDELRLRPSKFSRMYFTDESEKELQKAFIQRKVIPSLAQDMDFVKAEYRSQWDMLSMQWTRVATKCSGSAVVVRQGRLKSVMVKITGDGLMAVKNYKKVPFYSNKFRDEHGVLYTNPDEPRFPSKDQVPAIYRPSGVVRDVVEMRKTAPPRLIDLAALSSMLAGKGIKAKTVLEVYQKMYEAQVVSYPRTEDKVITPEQFNDLLPKVNAIAAVVGVDVHLLTHRSPRSTHVQAGGAHGANRPGMNVPSSLNDLSRFDSSKGAPCAALIYEILGKNYLAMFAEDYEYEYQKGHVLDYPKFVGTASVPKKIGWKAVFNEDDEPGEDDNNNGLGTKASPFVAEGVNPKPPTPTMKWLMKQLEKHDVGTGATRTSTYADITNDKSKSSLMVETKGKLAMTTCGDISYALLEGTLIGDVKVTERLMQEMRDIAAKKMTSAAGLHQVAEMVKHDMEVMMANAAKMGKSGVQGMATAPTKAKYTGTWQGNQVTFTRELGGRMFTDAECEALCRGETIVLNGLTSKSGSTYGIKGRLSNQKYNGHSFVGLENLGFADNVPNEWCKHKFTDAERAMLEMGKDVYIEGFVSSKGNVFSAHVRYGKTDKGSMGIIPDFNKT